MKKHSYTQTQFLIEIGGLLAFAYANIVLWARLAPDLGRDDVWMIAGGVLLAVLSADFLSGLVHWAGDTWGTEEWPLIGNSLIRTFREHHTDQTAITRHGFVETNGAQALTSLWIPMLALWLERYSSFWGLYFGMLALFMACTGQIHKWAHQERAPVVVRWLQKAKLLLGAEHHQGHHTAPFTKSYCITFGWMNRTLDGIRFFRATERVITWMTGAEPRAYEMTPAAREAAARARTQRA